MIGKTPAQQAAAHPTLFATFLWAARMLMATTTVVAMGHSRHFGFGRVGGRLVDKRPADYER